MGDVQVVAMDRPDEPLIGKSCTSCWTQVHPLLSETPLLQAKPPVSGRNITHCFCSWRLGQLNPGASLIHECSCIFCLSICLFAPTPCCALPSITSRTTSCPCLTLPASKACQKPYGTSCHVAAVMLSNLLTQPILPFAPVLPCSLGALSPTVALLTPCPALHCVVTLKSTIFRAYCLCQCALI